MNGGRSFFDTNVLIYLFDVSAPKKQERATALFKSKVEKAEAVLSYQVLQEFLNVMLRGKSPKMAVEECQVFVSALMDQCEMVRQSKGLLLKGLHNYKRYQISWYDSLIVAAAQLGDCPILFSEDLSHLQKYDGVQVVNPFL